MDAQSFFTKLMQPYKKGKIIMTGQRNWYNQIYEVNILQPQATLIRHVHPINNNPIINNLYHLTKAKEAIKYLHKCCFIPPIDSWCKAIDHGFFHPWLHLTSLLVQKHLELPIATVLGHQKELSRTYNPQNLNLSLLHKHQK